MTGGRGTLWRMGLLALCWGSSFLWIKIALGSLSPVQIAVARSVVGASVLVGVVLWTRNKLPRGKAAWGHLAVVGFFGNALPFVLFGYGELTVDSGTTGVINATTPLWALLIGMLIGTDRGLHPLRYAGLLLGFGGTLLIFAPWHAGSGLTSWGALAILAGAASYAVAYAYAGRTLVKRGIPPLSLAAAQVVSATYLTTAALPFDGPLPTAPAWQALVAVTVLGIFGTGLAYALNFRLIADEGPTNATVVGYLLPVVSVLLGAVFLNEALNLRIIIGMVVVLGGVALTRATRPTPKPVEDRKPAAVG